MKGRTEEDFSNARLMTQTCVNITHIRTQIYKRDSTDFRKDATEENILRNVKKQKE